MVGEEEDGPGSHALLGQVCSKSGKDDAFLFQSTTVPQVKLSNGLRWVVI